MPSGRDATGAKARDNPALGTFSDRLRAIDTYFARLLRPEHFPPRDLNVSVGIETTLHLQDFDGILNVLAIEKSPAHARDLRRAVTAPMTTMRLWGDLASRFEKDLLARFSPAAGPQIDMFAYVARLNARGRRAKPSDFYFPMAGAWRHGYQRRLVHMAHSRGMELPEDLLDLLTKYLRELHAARAKIAAWLGRSAPRADPTGGKSLRFTLGFDPTSRSYSIQGTPLKYEYGDKNPRYVRPGSQAAGLLLNLADGKNSPWSPLCNHLSRALQAATGGHLRVVNVGGKTRGLNSALKVPAKIATLHSEAIRSRPRRST